MAESDPLSLLASSALVKPEPLRVTRTALEVYRTRVNEAPAAMAAASAELAASAERAATVAAEAAAVAVRIQADAAMARQFNTVERTRLQKVVSQQLGTGRSERQQGRTSTIEEQAVQAALDQARSTEAALQRAQQEGPWPPNLGLGLRKRYFRPEHGQGR